MQNKEFLLEMLVGYKHQVAECLNALSVVDNTRALDYLEEAIVYDPTDAYTLNNLGYCYKQIYQRGDASNREYYDKSRDKYEKCIMGGEAPEEAYSGMIDLLDSAGNYNEKEDYIYRSVEAYPNSSDLLNIYALHLFSKLYDIEEVHGVFTRALEHSKTPKQEAMTLLNKGFVLQHCGNALSASFSYFNAYLQDPQIPKTTDNLLFSISFLTAPESATMLQFSKTAMPSITSLEHMSYVLVNNAYSPVTDRPVAPVNPRARIIGFIGGDFIGHAVSSFVLPLISHLYRPVYIYSTSSYTSSEINNLCAKQTMHSFHNIRGMDTAGVLSLIESHGIDLLIDLSGFTNKNRLDVIARAPVKCLSHIGSPINNGMCPRISDEYCEKNGSDQVVIMDGPFLCYSPPTHEIPITVSRPSDVIVFGSFCKLPKINREVVDVWVRILQQLPHSRLLLKSDVFRCHVYAAEFLGQFGGVKNQVVLLGKTNSIEEHIRLFNLIDLSLDTFPYSGTTITCESLYMGVPVLTMNSDVEYTSPISRVTGSILKHSGFEEYIASSKDDYIKKAVGFQRVPKNRVRAQFLGAQDPVDYARRFENAVCNV